MNLNKKNRSNKKKNYSSKNVETNTFENYVKTIKF